MNIFEINTRIWLKEISVKYNKEIKLGNIPSEEILYISKKGFTAVWLMGLWKKSPASESIVKNNERMLLEFKQIMPDINYRMDIGASPYAILDYSVDADIGTAESLIRFRHQLKNEKIELILDFVPNHTAIDHSMVDKNPDFFIRGTNEDIQNNYNVYFKNSKKDIIAHGKDPYFDAWTDVAQLNYFNTATREYMKNILKKLANMCDGVRCDMAMLILKKIQKQIWGSRTGYAEPELEFWQEVIPEIKKTHPSFKFIAEAYWGLEKELIDYGFDYVYDIDFYHALVGNDAYLLKNILKQDAKYGSRKLRFIENHDEPRSMSSIGYSRYRAAAVIMSLSYGGHLFYHGQLEGLSKKLPVQLLKRPHEEDDFIVYSFYKNLFKIIISADKESLNWEYFEPEPYSKDDMSYKNVLGYLAGELFIAVINYSDNVSRIALRPEFSKRLDTGNIIFKDMLGIVNIKINIDVLKQKGFLIKMAPYECYIFKIRKVNK